MPLLERYVCIFSIASPKNVKPTLWMTVNVKLTLLRYSSWPPAISTRGYLCIASPQNMSSWILSNVCRLFCVVVLVVVTVSCCCCPSVIVHPQLQMNNNNITLVKITTHNSNRKINLHKLFNLFCSDCSCCYCVILFFLILSIYSYRFTITHEQQQQHEKGTMTRTTQTNLQKLPSVQKLISAIHIPMYDLPVQQLNMKWSIKCEADLRYCTWPPDASTGGMSASYSIASHSKCQGNLMNDCKCKAWPHIGLLLTTRCLYWGYIYIASPQNRSFFNTEQCI